MKNTVFGNLWCLVLILLVGLSNFTARASSFTHAGEINSGGNTFLKYYSESLKTEYFITKVKEPLPILLYIQGSGCRPVFLSPYYDDYMSSVFSLLKASSENKFSVMVVNKPNVSYSNSQEKEDMVHNCSKSYHESFYYENWLNSIREAFQHAKTLPITSSDSSMVIGVSEGAVVASGLVKEEPSISHVGLVGLTSSQVFDFIYSSYDSQTDSQAIVNIEEVVGQVREILNNPLDTDRFAWGHSYRRWSSFFKVDPVKNLINGNAKVFLVSGMKDKSVPVISTEAVYSDLVVAQKDVEFVRIPEANHNLMPEGSNDWQSIEKYYQQIRSSYFEGK